MDCRDGHLTADWNAEIGNAIPSSVYHRHVLRFRVRNDLTCKRVNELLKQIAPLAERVVDGYTSEWDGSNMVGQFTDDADIACETIAIILDAESEDF